MGDQPDQQRETSRCFVIVCASRSGSTYLANLLHRHPDIRCHGELLDAREMFGYHEVDPSRLTAAGRKARLDERLRGSVAFYQKAMFDTDHQRVGSKILYQQLFGVVNTSVTDWLVRHHDIDVVHLRRADGLARYVSELRHNRDRSSQNLRRQMVDRARWAPAANAVDRLFGRWPRSGTGGPVVVDIDRAIESIDNQRHAAARVDDWFVDHRCLDLVYEDFVADADTHWAALLDFLGVTHRPLDPDQRPRPLADPSQLVANWDEVSADPRL